MSGTPFIVSVERPGLSRQAFLGRCAWLANVLAETQDGALMPLCGRRGDVMATLVAGLSTGRRIILPNDNGAPAVAAVAAEAGPALLVLSADDVALDLPVPILRLSDEAVAGTATEDPDWRQGPPVTLYTSGSTGQPVAHHHTPALFLAGAAAWAERLELGDAPATIVATVPAQHMYGLEASIILPLVRPRTSVFDGRPFYPADIQAALHAVDGRRVLVTTPLHLRALVRSGLTLPPLHAIVSATAALAPDLARAAEDLWAAPVIEIYGSTETGLAATRRPARSPLFRLRCDLTLQATAEGAVLHGPHLPAPVTLHDRVAPEGQGFRLLGRGSDLVNVAGKRASLAGLTAHLLAVEGVVDGVIVVPEKGDLARPVAIAVAPTLTATAVRDALRHLLPDVFVPRRVLLVDALPRNNTGKLSKAAIDALLTPPGFTIAANHPALPGHFPGNPVVPGVVVLDHALRLAGRSGPLHLRSVKFLSVLRPDEPCTVDLSDGARGLTVTCRSGDRTVLTALVARDAP